MAFESGYCSDYPPDSSFDSLPDTSYDFASDPDSNSNSASDPVSACHSESDFAYNFASHSDPVSDSAAAFSSVLASDVYEFFWFYSYGFASDPDFHSNSASVPEFCFLCCFSF